jgi:phage recombination protein Bet
MTNTIVFKGEQIAITDEQLRVIRTAISTQEPTDAELRLYFYDCDRRGVHPLDKLIHFSKRKGRYVPIVGIDYMRQRAESSGAYAGNDDAVFVYDEYKNIVSATVVVWKLCNGVRCQFSATARWAEYAPEDIKASPAFMWRKMPHTMLAKCAEALALRKAFPGQLAGLYSTEEMAQDDRYIKDGVVDVSPEESKPTTNTQRPYSPEALKNRLAIAAEKNKGKICTDMTRKVTAAALSKIFEDDADRYAFTEWVTGVASTKNIPSEYVLAFQDWMGSHSFETEPSELSKTEGMFALRQVIQEIIEKAQIEMNIEQEKKGNEK